MADIMSILSQSYASAALSTPSSTPYTNVDPASYQGSWQGTYSNNQKFQFTISQGQRIPRAGEIPERFDRSVPERPDQG